MKPMVKVVMLKDAKGAPDSVTVREYKAGEEHLLPEDLAECFFSTGDADPAEAHAPAQIEAQAGDDAKGAEGAGDAEKPATRKPRGGKRASAA